MKSMSGSDFVKSMLRSEEKKDDDLFVVGMAKVAPDDRDSIMLGPTHKCGPWTKVPLSAILRVVPLANCPCKQHEHPVVAVYFKDKDDPVAVVLGRLLRDMQKDMYSQMMRTSGGGRSLARRSDSGLGEGAGGLDDWGDGLGCIIVWQLFCWLRDFTNDYPHPAANPDDFNCVWIPLVILC